MNIKERIEKIGKYFHSMNVASEDNVIYVRVMFPKGWGCSELTEYNYNVKAVADEIPGYFYFFADMEIGFENIFNAIDFNIHFNEEAQAKVGLLRDKIEELKNIFETEDIDTLKTLEFKYKKKKEKITKNKTKKNKIDSVDETPSNNTNETNYTSETQTTDTNKEEEIVVYG